MALERDGKGRIVKSATKEKLENTLQKIWGPALAAEVAERLGMDRRTVSKALIQEVKDPKSPIKGRLSGRGTEQSSTWIFWHRDFEGKGEVV